MSRFGRKWQALDRCNLCLGQGTHIINWCTGSRSSVWIALDPAQSNTAVTQATCECRRDDSLQRNVLGVPLSNNRDPHDKPQGFNQSEYKVKCCES